MLFKPRILALVVTLFMLSPALSSAQESAAEVVHWAYASFLGTGWYNLDDNREVYVIKAQPRWYFRDSSIDESGQRQVGIQFQFPLTFGLHQLEAIDDIIDFDNVGTVSFNPGVELEFPVTKRWYLRAYTHLGWGASVDTKDRAWVYDAGLKSRYAFSRGKLEWNLVNGVFFAGYNARSSGADSLGGLLAALDFAYPINFGSGPARALKLKWNVGYRWYENDLSFPRQAVATKLDLVSDEWEVGVALARQDGPIKIGFMKFEHMGLIYRFNSDGSFKAITVNFRSPFTR